MPDPWLLTLLVLPASWWLMHRSYRWIWHHRLRWWAIPFAHGAVLFGHRLERWER